jgi:COX assembly protein 2
MLTSLPRTALSIQVVKALIDCHEDNPWGKFFGSCNDAKVLLDQCFREEKEERRRENLAKAREFESRWKRVREEEEASGSKSL